MTTGAPGEAIIWANYAVVAAAVLLVPCLRATFDAIACIIVYSAVGRVIRNRKKFFKSTSTLPPPHDEGLSELFAEGMQELGMIFVIMTVEAVFVQMPSVRAHARNYIAPFVDSWTAILTTRFILRLTKRKQQEPDDSSSTHSGISWPLSDEEAVWEPEPDSSPMIAAWPARVVDGLSPIEFGAASVWFHAEAPSVRDGEGLHSIAETQRVRAVSVLTPEKPPKSTLCAEAGLATGFPAQNVPVDQAHGNVEFDRTFLTADGKPPKFCIPPPPLGGWYLPTGIDRHRLLDSVDPNQIESWEMLEQDGPSSFATLAGDSIDPPHEARLIHSNLADLLNVQCYSFNVCPAVPPIATAGQNPNVFLITGLSEFLNDAIQRQQVVSAPGITFFIYRSHPDPQFSGFMGTIFGLEFEDSVAGDSAALEAIRSAVMVNKRFTSAVFSHCDPLPAGVCSEDILARLQNSIAIRPIELRPTEPHTAYQGHRIAYRVYADLPTTDPSAYRAIRIAFRRTRVIPTMGLFGSVINDFTPCRICRSIDHPAPLCPYPNYPGWRGPTAATITALDEAAHECSYPTGNGSGDHLP
ncbi:hypothetical protein B0H13DRAFT_2321964 [Mycena leptocephala]|nr:hypothetical protein B0H13DRAFT_2321964 [Mycena leptocephala]